MMIKTTTTAQRFSRRSFLQRVGAGAAFLPLIHAERALGAGPGGSPKRLVLIAWTNGVAQSHFYPAGEDPVASDVLKTLAPVKSKVLVPLGLDIKVMLDAGKRFDGHFSYPSLFTGTYRNIGGQNGDATGPSLDYVVSQHFAKSVNLPIPLMNTTAVAGKNNISYRGPGARNAPESSPARLFDRLFQSNLSGGNNDALRARRKSVLDHLKQDLASFGTRLGAEDKQKIESHLESVRQLETQLASSSGGSCAAPAKPSGDAYQTKIAQFNQLAAIALRCDATRVVTMVWGDDGGYFPRTFDFVGVGGDYHNLAHQGPGGYSRKVRTDIWLYEQVADLAKRLDATDEGGRTALDNSAIVVANDMDEGNSHQNARIPFVVVGGAGGALRTGRAVRLGNWRGKTGAYWRADGGVPHNRLLATIAAAMGVPTQGFGASNYSGLLPELQA
jgi:hypothetical protein